MLELETLVRNVPARSVTAPEPRPAEAILCPDPGSSVRWSPGERLHHLFEDRCDQLAKLGRIQHPAIEYATATFTYDELDRRANRLARYLLGEGVRSGDIVGLLFDKSIHCYVALLAVLKINAAYVPLDPGFPPERVGYIADDAGVRAILSLLMYRDRLRDLKTPVICLDLAEPAVEAQRGERLGPDEIGMPRSELCYIVYTSGSTGRPKGVPINQGSICNFVRVAGEVYGYCSDDRVYQGLTIAFDFSVEEIWVPLIAGATLIPNWTGSTLVGADLWSFLANVRVSALCCVPTLLATIEDDLPDLRLLIVSGEACPQALVERWHRPGRTILNAYGPTETTVTATIAKLQPDEPVTIGAPLPTYSVVILAPGENRLLARGEIGEICIGGMGLSEGYLGREDLTRAAFVEDFLDLPNNPAKRIYRTGDLGALNERGQIEYFGRIDTQVKIRGYRVELGEIDSVIMQLPQIAQAVVHTFEPDPGAIELVAYYTLVEGASDPGPEDMALRLLTLLPSYMVPAYYERLPVIPMLPCDKVDRKALPAPSGGRLRRTNRDYVPPEGALESRIAAILAELLQLEQVSVTDDFFDDLGANSLLMARFGARIREQLGISDFSMRDIYGYPSVRQLCGLLQSNSKRRTPLRRNQPNHIATDFGYYSCGAMQLLVIFVYIYFYLVILIEGYSWTLEASGFLDAYGRATAFSAASLAVFVSVPIGLKWLLIGKWKKEEIPVWGRRYLKFWTVKQLIRFNPMIAFVGSPLYIAYLKALGVRIGWNSAIFSTTVPVCTDLVTIGDGAVIRKDAIFPAYRVESNRIRTGPITIGRNAFVGEGSVLDIDTVMEDAAQLGHASCLYSGQRLAAGRRYHGCPAEETDTNYDLLEHGTVSFRRRVGYSLAQLGSLFFVYMPLPPVLAHALFATDASLGSTVVFANSEAPYVVVVPLVLAYTLILYLAGLLSGLALTIGLPRIFYVVLRQGKTYNLYGFYYYLYRSILSISNSKLYNRLFGDSSFIVYYLQALGYRFPNLVQTGSNFGVEHKHDIPFLCEFGEGTMVSDGLAMINADMSNSAFRLSEAAVAANSFLGNDIYYPPQARIGEDCLIATKAMIPMEGPVREHTGLLGSPSFPIPRSVRRDKQFDKYKSGSALHERLKMKNKSNAITILAYLFTHWLLFSMIACLLHVIFVDLERRGALWAAGVIMFIVVFGFLYRVLLVWIVLGFRSLQPKYCSIYDEYYWKHERYWKFNIVDMTGLLNGTPFKNLASWLLGVRIGRKVFDDGCGISEMTLVTIGDYCTLNERCGIQAHSLEEGTFKSDHIVIGAGCTIGVNALVHYGVIMGDDAGLEPDSFLMKGERPRSNTSWRGNPAKEVQTAEPALARSMSAAAWEQGVTSF